MTSISALPGQVDRQASRQQKNCTCPLSHCHRVSLADGEGPDRVYIFFVLRTTAAFAGEALGGPVRGARGKPQTVVREC